MTTQSQTQVGGYRIVSHLGAGGMGEVYLAIDQMLEREVALKTLRPEMGSRPELVERFRIEAIALARLHHRHIAQVYAFFEANGSQHIAMQYVRGHTLEAELLQRGRLPWRAAVAVAMDVLQALTHAHALGVVHRDLKPANLMLDHEGRTVVMDFGIARVLARERQTRAGTLVGTLEYIAPEIVQGKPADARSDLYALGVVLFEMVTGRLPFQAESDFELMRAHAEQAPPLPVLRTGDLPPAVEALVLRLLEKDPAHRPASAAAAAEALADAAQTASRSGHSAAAARRRQPGAAWTALRHGLDLPGAGGWPAWRAWLKGNPGLAGVAVVALFALGAVGGQAVQPLCCAPAPLDTQRTLAAVPAPPEAARSPQVARRFDPVPLPQPRVAEPLPPAPISPPRLAEALPPAEPTTAATRPVQPAQPSMPPTAVDAGWYIKR